MSKKRFSTQRQARAIGPATIGLVLVLICASAEGQAPPAPAPSAEEAAGAVPLGKRYVDAMHGYSLRPPAEAQRARESAAGQLVNWSHYDEQTGAIDWALSVHRAVEANPPAELKAYADALAQKLLAEKDLKVETTELAPVAGKAAIHFRGTTLGIAMWQRQTWILSQPGAFLVVTMQGPKDRAERLDRIAEAVLGSVEVHDPTAALEQRRANLDRGEKLLTSLTGRELAGAIRPEAQWYLLRLDGETVGFRRVVESPARREGADGYLVKTLVLLEMPNFEPRLMRQELFVTPELDVERWGTRLQVGSGDGALVVDESGLKQEELIVCNVLQGDKLRTFKKQIPGRFYLPQAIGVLLPRLVKLDQLAAYGFAAYDAERNDFNLRTFTVVGPQRASIGGQEVDAFVATDRAADDAEPARLILDAQGNLLQMQTADGLVMERASETAVMSRLPRAAGILKAAGE